MKVALVQMSPHLGDTQKNLNVHLETIGKAQKMGVDLVIFPELSLTGYTLQDLVPDVAVTPGDSRVLEALQKAGGKTAVVVGFIEERADEKGIFYNSAAYLQGGKVLHIHRKVFLPTFGMFDETRFFAQGKNFFTFPTPAGRTGMMICRDFLSYGAGYLLFAGGAEMIIIISAAPGRGLSEEEGFASSRMWEIMGEMLSRFSNAFCMYCNRVGFEDGKPFAGGSFIYSPFGKLLGRAPYTESHLLVRDIDLNEVREARKNWPYKRDDKPEIILESLKRIVGKYEY